MSAPKPETAGKATTLTEEQYLELLGQANPEWPDRIRKFLDQVAPLGVGAEYQKSLILRWHAPDGTPINLAYIDRYGKVETSAVNWNTKDLGALPSSHQYVADLAAAIGGTVSKDSKDENWWVKLGKTLPTIGVLLDHADAWLAAIEKFTTAVAKKVED